MLGNLMDLLSGDGLGDAGDLIGTLGKVVTKAKPVEQKAETKTTKSDGGGLLDSLIGAATNRPTEIRLVVLDGKGKEKRDMSLPISIVRTALDLGADALNLDEKFDPDYLITLLETRDKGLLFDFDDPADDDVIKIYLQ